MNRADIHKAMQEAGGGTAYIDLADEGCFILDGSFTLAEIAAMGDVARGAIEQQSVHDALDEAVDQFGAERLAKALVEPRVGDTIRVTHAGANRAWFRNGDFGRMVRIGRGVLLVDFNDPRNRRVVDGGHWSVSVEDCEVIR